MKDEKEVSLLIGSMGSKINLSENKEFYFNTELKNNYADSSLQDGLSLEEATRYEPKDSRHL